MGQYSIYFISMCSIVLHMISFSLVTFVLPISIRIVTKFKNIYSSYL